MNHLLVHDLEAGATTTALSVSAAAFPDGIYGAPSISDDGRLVAFGLRSSTLLGGNASTTAQVVVLDRSEPDPVRALALESMTSHEEIGDGPSAAPLLSRDGRYLLFRTRAPNLSGDPAATIRSYLMVRDRSQLTTVVASSRADGTSAWVTDVGFSLSGDGAVVAFVADVAVVSPGAVGEHQVFAAPRP